MPREDRLGGHEPCEIQQCLSADGLAGDGQPTSLFIREPDPAVAELFAQDTVLFPREVDRGLLVTVDPACECRAENLPGLDDLCPRSESRTERWLGGRFHFVETSGKHRVARHAFEYLDTTGWKRLSSPVARSPILQLQPTNEMPDELGEAIDRLRDAEKRFRGGLRQESEKELNRSESGTATETRQHATHSNHGVLCEFRLLSPIRSIVSSLSCRTPVSRIPVAGARCHA